MKKKKEAQKSKTKKKKSSQWYLRFLRFFGIAFLYFFKYLWFALKFLVVKIYESLKYLFKPVQKEVKKARIARSRKKSKFRLIDSIKGNYQKFWSKLLESDSLIGLIIGARGSGKTAVALSLAENIRATKKHVYGMGFSKSELPKWIKKISKIDELENDALVIIDEGGILFSSRDAMSNANKLLSELLFIARHKNLTILFISQNSSNLEINTLRQADFMILKKSSLLQEDFERKIIAKIYKEYSKEFNNYSDIKGVSLIYSDSFVGFTDNDLPSFWSDKVSKAFR